MEIIETVQQQELLDQDSKCVITLDEALEMASQRVKASGLDNTQAAELAFHAELAKIRKEYIVKCM